MLWASLARHDVEAEDTQESQEGCKGFGAWTGLCPSQGGRQKLLQSVATWEPVDLLARVFQHGVFPQQYFVSWIDFGIIWFLNWD